MEEERARGREGRKVTLKYFGQFLDQITIRCCFEDSQRKWNQVTLAKMARGPRCIWRGSGQGT